MAKPAIKPREEIHVDILDMEIAGNLPHWLSPSQKNPAAFDAIRAKHRARWLAEQKAKREKAFDESQHPRDEQGRWTEGGGDGNQPAPPDLVTTPILKNAADFEPQWSKFPGDRAIEKTQEAIRDWVGDDWYSTVNAGLRGDERFVRSDAERKHAEDIVEGLDNVFEYDAHELTEDAIVYRGLGSRFKEEAPTLFVGSTFTDAGYASTSNELLTAHNFSHGGYLVEITIPKGTKIFSPYVEEPIIESRYQEGQRETGPITEEPEILTARGSRYVVTAITEVEGVPLYHVRLTEPVAKKKALPARRKAPAEKPSRFVWNPDDIEITPPKGEKAFDESKHPRDPKGSSTGGQFTSGGGGAGEDQPIPPEDADDNDEITGGPLKDSALAKQAQNVANNAAGQKTGGFKCFKPSNNVEEHLSRVNQIISNPALRNKLYRWQTEQLMKEHKALGFASGAASKLQQLHLKVAESFYSQGQLHLQKGKTETGNKHLAKAAKMGYKPAPTSPAVVPPPAPPPVAKPGGSPDSTWTKVGPQKGSNPGGTYTDPKGVKWYVKTPKTENHVNADLLSNELYRIVGAKVPEEIKTTLDGKPALASKIIDNAKELGQSSPTEQAKAIAQLKENFGADAWLANWDVIGLNQDNVLISAQGTAFRLDQGGTLMFRAQGETKPFPPSPVQEIWTMRDPKMAPEAAAVYGGMTKQEQIDSIKRVTAINPAVIRAVAKKYDMPETGETLISRQNYLKGSVKALEDAIAAEKKKDPPPPPAPPVLTADMEKAKKTTPIPQTGINMADLLINQFNNKYQGKPITEPDALKQKAIDYKELMAKVNDLKLKDVANKQAAAKLKAEQELAKLYGDDPEAKQHFATLAAITGGGSGEAKSMIKEAKEGIDNLKALGVATDMTPVQGANIVAYTSSYYREVNSMLRAGSITEQSYYFARNLSDALKKLPDWVGTSYRGTNITPPQADKYKPGYVVFEHQFTSSSKSHSTGSGWGKIRFIIEGKGGKDVSQISRHPSENEILYDMNSVFRVTKREGNDIHMTQIA